ncbi:MAG: hypothetical protein AAFO74_04305 [Pseudomonadota bacterium]
MTDQQEQLLSDMRALLDHLRQGIENQDGLNPDIEAGINQALQAVEAELINAPPMH